MASLNQIVNLDLHPINQSEKYLKACKNKLSGKKFRGKMAESLSYSNLIFLQPPAASYKKLRNVDHAIVHSYNIF